MSRARVPGAERAFREGKLRDRALILPIVGLILFLPPVATIFQVDARIAGIPITAIYLFSVWAALIAASAWLAPQLREVGAPEPAPDDAAGQGPPPA